MPTTIQKKYPSTLTVKSCHIKPKTNMNSYSAREKQEGETSDRVGSPALRTSPHRTKSGETTVSTKEQESDISSKEEERKDTKTSSCRFETKMKRVGSDTSVQSF